MESYESCSPARNGPMPIRFSGPGAENRRSSEFSMPMGIAALSMAMGD